MVVTTVVELNRNESVNESVEVGKIVERTDVQSSIGPFHFVPEYKVHYPVKVIQALSELYQEYNMAFTDLVEKNREWPTDYQYCMFGPGGTPVNCGVQIDMVGLTPEFLEAAPGMSLAEVKEFLRRHIFEIENSLAMYQLLEKSFWDGRNSFFKERFRAALDELRQRFGMPIALLAVTDQKYEAMKASEFGKGVDEALSGAEVKELSGFDAFWGPEEFLQHLAEHNGECRYLLYARTSDPVAKLKKPGVEVEQPLLGDLEIRRVIKANALTFNVDAPEMEFDAFINDTKEYMPVIGMGYIAHSETDVYSTAFTDHLQAGRAPADFFGEKFTPAFAHFLQDHGVAAAEISSGDVMLRTKPLKCCYGCYGHVFGSALDRKFRSEFRRNLRKRGAYIVQLEMDIPRLESVSDRQEYMYIDRNFFAFTNGAPRFLGGFRSLMPMDSVEAKKGRNHGSQFTVWAEVLPAAD